MHYLSQGKRVAIKTTKKDGTPIVDKNTGRNKKDWKYGSELLDIPADRNRCWLHWYPLIQYAMSQLNRQCGHALTLITEKVQ